MKSRCRVVRVACVIQNGEIRLDFSGIIRRLAVHTRFWFVMSLLGVGYRMSPHECTQPLALFVHAWRRLRSYARGATQLNSARQTQRSGRGAKVEALGWVGSFYYVRD